MSSSDHASAAAALIVLTGPLGAGKTVARLVAGVFDPSVHLPADDFWRFIQAGMRRTGDRSRKPRTLW